jgi:hypothetical protein
VPLQEVRGRLSRKLAMERHLWIGASELAWGQRLMRWSG